MAIAAVLAITLTPAMLLLLMRQDRFHFRPAWLCRVANAVLVGTIHNELPPGYHLEWAGQFQYLERAKSRLAIVVPFTLLIVFILLYVNTGSIAKTLIILLAVPFSAVGAIWLLWFLGYNMSIAVWVGLIALLGVDAETGVFMLLYLDLASEERRRGGRLTSRRTPRGDHRGGGQAPAPKVMTVGVMFMGLLPILWSQGTGADVMKRIAAPMVGGIFTSFLMELLVYPAIYSIWRGREVDREASAIGS